MTRTLTRVIDTHAYIGTQPKIGLDIQVSDYYRLKEKLWKHGIDTQFLVMSASLRDNYNIAKIVSDNKKIVLGGVLQIAPNRLMIEQNGGITTPKEIENLLSSKEIKGLKLVTSLTRTAVNDPVLDDYASLAVKYDVPMIFHCSATGQDFTKPEYFLVLKQKHPKLRIVCAHYGGLNEKFIPPYIELVRNNHGIYLNTSGLSGEIKRYISIDPLVIHHENNPNRWTNTFLETIKGIEDRVIFGSDYPELKFTIHPIDLADKPTQERVFYKNAKTIFKL